LAIARSRPARHFPGTAAGLQERRIDRLDADAAVLHQLDGARDLNQLAGGDVRGGCRELRVTSGI
jgi:hypothetical protein